MNIPLVVYNKDKTLANLFSNSLLPNSNFPLRIRIPSIDLDKCLHGELSAYLKNYDMTRATNRDGTTELILLSVSKLHLDRLILRLKHSNIRYSLDYTQFRSNPCNLFIKNLNNNADEASLRQFIEAHCPHKSLNEIVIISNNDSKDSMGNTPLGITTFAIAKFANHLDVDYLLDNKQLLEVLPNKFNSDPNVPLYINPYISKRERTLRRKTSSALSRSSFGSPTNFAANNSYNCIVLQGLDRFFEGKLFTISEFRKFLDKFNLFELSIIDIHFPIVEVDEGHFLVKDFGYISFDDSQEYLDINFNVLMLIYYLYGLTLSEFMEFDDINLTKLNCTKKETTDKSTLNPNGLRIVINQAKFNSLLQKDSTPSLEIGDNNEIRVTMYKDLNYLYRSLNFQETNIYVNNLPLIFKQDDILWETFWSNLGDFNLAKIIKPDFYKNSVNSNGKAYKSNSVGKIGFVFFKDFKTAIRAILLTNNKYLKFNGQILHIQSSFAIQKVSGSQNRSISSFNSSLNLNQNKRQYNYSNGSQSGYIPRNPPPGMYDNADGQNMQFLGPMPPLLSNESASMSNVPPFLDQDASVQPPSPPCAGPYSGFPYFYYPMIPSNYYYYALYSDNT